MKWFCIVSAALIFAILIGPFPAYLESVEAHQCTLNQQAKQHAYLLTKKELECRMELAKSIGTDYVLKLCKTPSPIRIIIKEDKDAGCGCQ